LAPSAAAAAAAAAVSPAPAVVALVVFLSSAPTRFTGMTTGDDVLAPVLVLAAESGELPPGGVDD